MRPFVRAAAAAVAAASLCAPVTAQEGYAPSEVAAAIGVDETAAALVPEALRDAPLGFSVYGNTPFTMTGEDLRLYGAAVDLGAAIAAKLGLEAVIEDVASVAASKVAVESGRYQIGLGPFLDSPEAEADFHLIRWIRVTPGFVFRAGEGYADPMEFCGKAIAIVSGSVPVERNAAALSAACTEAGEAAPTVDAYGDQNAMLVAILSGRADGAILSSASALYIASQQADSFGAFSAETDLFNVGLYSGLGVALDQPELAEAVLAAMQSLLESGEYEAIFAQYGLEGLIVDEVAINPLAAE